MAAIGTGTTVGITIWVVSDGTLRAAELSRFIDIADTDLDLGLERGAAATTRPSARNTRRSSEAKVGRSRARSISVK